MIATASFFPIPLAAPLDDEDIFVLAADYVAGMNAKCDGTFADPQADSGFLCVYLAERANLFPPPPFPGVLVSAPDTLTSPSEPEDQETGTSGAVLWGVSISGHPAFTGTFAVTG